MKTGVTLITMGAGNVGVLRETLKSASAICDEVIYGDMLLFDNDREVLNSYKEEFNLKILQLPFNFIFKFGFSAVLNTLAKQATNDLVLYLNTSEIIDKDNGVLGIVNAAYNCYYFDHATDPHRWFRFYDKRELQWSGRIHESLEPLPGFEFKPYHKAAFRMADLEKDMDNAFKAQVFNDVKEIVYFHNYMSIIDNPEQLGATDPGWIKFAKENYDSMKERLKNKGDRYLSFVNGRFDLYARSTMVDGWKTNEEFISNIGIEYQGDKKYLL